MDDDRIARKIFSCAAFIFLALIIFMVIRKKQKTANAMACMNQAAPAMSHNHHAVYVMPQPAVVMTQPHAAVVLPPHQPTIASPAHAHQNPSYPRY